MSKRLDEIRRYCDTYSGSSDVEKIEYVLAELDRLTKDRDEARAQQAHTASCNIELMRKLEKANEALRFYADENSYAEYSELRQFAPGFGSFEAETCKVLKDFGEKARKALIDAAEEDDRLFRECDIEKFGEEK